MLSFNQRLHYEKFLPRYVSYSVLIVMVVLSIALLVLNYHINNIRQTETGALAEVTSLSPTLFVPNNVIWSADHETGDLSQWEGEAYDSGGCITHSASTDVAHSGRYSMKLTIDTSGGESGCRQFRMRESMTGNPYYYSGWLYVPVWTRGNSYWNVVQFKSNHDSNQGCHIEEPFWVIDIRNRNTTGPMYLRLRYKGGEGSVPGVPGPYQTDPAGTKYYDQYLKDILPGQWTHVEIYMKQSSTYTGRVTVWQDGVQLWDFDQVVTKYPAGWAGCAPEGDERWSLNNYTDRISPNPGTLYWDDATISSTQVGPGILPSPSPTGILVTSTPIPTSMPPTSTPLPTSTPIPPTPTLTPTRAPTYTPRPTPSTIPTPTSSSAFTIRSEAESGSIVSPMKVYSDTDASNGKYIMNTSSSKSGSTTYTVTVPITGNYFIWARTIGTGDTKNSFYVLVDGANSDVYDVPITLNWFWNKVSGRTSGNPRYFYLTSGTHRIQFKSREYYTKLDQFILTNNPSLQP